MQNGNNETDKANISNIMPYENAIHDIKGPMTIIYTYVQMLEANKNIPEEAKKQISAIKRNCFKALKLINDLNDSSKIYNGNMMPKFNNTNIVETIKSITEATDPFTFKKNISLSFECDISEKIIATDRSLLERALLNLLSNSIKFTNFGGEVKVLLLDKCDVVELIVKDNGKGIEDEELGFIFQRYHTTDIQQGRGIGLSIVREIVKLLKGNIDVKSVVGSGTEMIIKLPVFLINEEEATLKYYDDFYLDNMIQIELADEYF